MDCKKPRVHNDISSDVISNRRTRNNKYSKFSKAAALDPLLSAIQEAEKNKAAVELKHNPPSRGTTVPFETTTAEIIPHNATFERKNVIPSDPFTFGYVNIGTITGPHGVKGEVKIVMSTDFGDIRTQSGSVLYIKRPNRLTPRPIRIDSARKQTGNGYLICFKGIESRLSAASLKGYSLFVKRDDRPPLEHDEYLVRDLVGLECFERSATDPTVLVGPIGKVEGVVPPDELCSPETAKLMHAMIEVR